MRTVPQAAARPGGGAARRWRSLAVAAALLSSSLLLLLAGFVRETRRTSFRKAILTAASSASPRGTPSMSHGSARSCAMPCSITSSTATVPSSWVELEEAARCATAPVMLPDSRSPRAVARVDEAV